MGRITGEEAVIEIGATVVGKVTGWGINEEATIATGRALGEDWDETATTSKRWTFTAEMDLDETDAGQLLLAAGATGTGKFYTDGDASGKVERTGAFVITSHGFTVSKDGYTTLSIAGTGNGALTKETLA